MVYLLGFRASGLGDLKRDPSFRELPTGAFDCRRPKQSLTGAPRSKAPMGGLSPGSGAAY